MYERNPFFSGDFAVSDFMRAIARSASNSELEKCEVIMETIEFVVEAGIF